MTEHIIRLSPRPMPRWYCSCGRNWPLTERPEAGEQHLRDEADWEIVVEALAVWRRPFSRRKARVAVARLRAAPSRLRGRP